MLRTKLYVHPAHEGFFKNLCDFLNFLKRHGYSGKESVMEADDLVEAAYDAPMEGGAEVLGFSYLPWQDVEDDNVKTFHEFTSQQGTLSMDWSPYSTPTLGDVLLWLDLGAPKRVGTGPLTRQDLENLACNFGRNAR